MVDEVLKEIKEAVVHGQAVLAKEVTTRALLLGVVPLSIVDQALIPAMEQVGSMFRVAEIHIPNVLMASRAMHAAMYVLRPFLGAGKQGPDKVVLGTVAGDLHDIGKRLVAMMLQAKGFSVIDVGIDIPPEGFVDAVREHKPALLGLSCLLTTTMSSMHETIEELCRAGLRNQVIVLVGGGPVTEEFATAIGADGFARDAVTAVETAQFLLARRARHRKSHLPPSR